MKRQAAALRRMSSDTRGDRIDSTLRALEACRHDDEELLMGGLRTLHRALVEDDLKAIPRAWLSEMGKRLSGGAARPQPKPEPGPHPRRNDQR
jgi:hypothetical protein